MSYDITTQVFARRAAADAEAAADSTREVFLRKLDEAGFDVGDWEAQFIESFLQARGNWWTPKRRAAADKMLRAYAHRLPEFRSHTAAPPPGASAQFPPHVQGQCGYIVRNAERQLVRCGQPVAYRTPGGLEICADHHAARVAWRKRTTERKRRKDT